MNVSKHIRISRALSFTVAAGALFLAACSTPESSDPDVVITQEQVDGHILALSSDEMRGRDAFSEDIRIAEDYIEEKFLAAGLSPFESFGGFRDEFVHEARSRRNPEAPAPTYNLANIVGFCGRHRSGLEKRVYPLRRPP